MRAKLSCSRTQHNVPSQAQTRTARLKTNALTLNCSLIEGLQNYSGVSRKRQAQKEEVSVELKFFPKSLAIPWASPEAKTFHSIWGEAMVADKW